MMPTCQYKYKQVWLKKGYTCCFPVNRNIWSLPVDTNTNKNIWKKCNIWCKPDDTNTNKNGWRKVKYDAYLSINMMPTCRYKCKQEWQKKGNIWCLPVDYNTNKNGWVNFIYDAYLSVKYKQ